MSGSGGPPADRGLFEPQRLRPRLLYIAPRLEEHGAMEPNSNAVGQRDRYSDQMPGVLLLIVRRYFLPVALTVAVLDAGFLLIATEAAPLWSSPPHLVLAGLLLPSLPIGFGMLVIGLPVGYLVARLRLGLVESLALLVAIGFGLPAALATLLIGAPTQGLIFGIPGGLAAAIWTLVNHDLFRRHNGA